MAETPIVVFADGAAKGNPGPGGWGAIVVTPEGRVTELGGGVGHTTNNRMELTATIEALRHIGALAGPVAVHTDSTYVIRGIQQWIHGWRRRGWRTAGGGEVLNRDLWEKLAEAENRAGRVTWHYVRGHRGIPGNERVDEIAIGLARPCRSSGISVGSTQTILGTRQQIMTANRNHRSIRDDSNNLRRGPATGAALNDCPARPTNSKRSRGVVINLDEIIARATGPGGPELGDHRYARGTCCLDRSLCLRPNYRTACRP